MADKENKESCDLCDKETDKVYAYGLDPADICWECFQVLIGRDND